MLDVTLSVLALIAGGVSIEVFAIARSQFGTEGETVLQTESRAIAEESQTGNPS